MCLYILRPVLLTRAIFVQLLPTVMINGRQCYYPLKSEAHLSGISSSIVYCPPAWNNITKCLFLKHFYDEGFENICSDMKQLQLGTYGNIGAFLSEQRLVNNKVFVILFFKVDKK